MLINYLDRLIQTWGAKAFAVAEIVAFLVASYSTKIIIPSWTYWLIATISFLYANFEIFREVNIERDRLQALINEMEGSEALLTVKVNKSSFIHSAPVLTFGGRFEDGLMPDGLPIEAIASAELEIHNLGEEDGELDLSLNLGESDLPEIFSIKSESSSGIPKLPDRIPGRERLVVSWRLQCWMHEKNSYRFAEGLMKAERYKFVIDYRTLRVSDPTEFRSFIIEGTFDHYRSELLRRWRELGHSELLPPNS